MNLPRRMPASTPAVMPITVSMMIAIMASLSVVGPARWPARRPPCCRRSWCPGHPAAGCPCRAGTGRSAACRGCTRPGTWRRSRAGRAARRSARPSDRPEGEDHDEDDEGDADDDRDHLQQPADDVLAHLRLPLVQGSEEPLGRNIASARRSCSGGPTLSAMFHELVVTSP